LICLALDLLGVFIIFINLSTLDKKWHENREDNERSYLFDRQTDGNNLDSEGGIQKITQACQNQRLKQI
jgi:hypothetical protein